MRLIDLKKLIIKLTMTKNFNCRYNCGFLLSKMAWLANWVKPFFKKVRKEKKRKENRQLISFPNSSSLSCWLVIWSKISCLYTSVRLYGFNLHQWMVLRLHFQFLISFELFQILNLFHLFQFRVFWSLSFYPTADVSIAEVYLFSLL